MNGDNFNQIPLDSDSPPQSAAVPPEAARRPLHLDVRLLVLVAFGGALGTGVREALSLTWPVASGAFPSTIFGINIVGAFILGLLLEVLSQRGSDEGARRTARLLVGTGVLGGFTTYSSLATSVAGLAAGHLGVALLYAVASLLGGFIASVLGIATAHRVGRRHLSPGANQ